MTRPESCLKVVIDPLVMVQEMMAPEQRPVLVAWRDGHIRPVITRRILAHTLNLFRKIGLSVDVIQIWALWLTHRDRSSILTQELSCESMQEEYTRAAVLSGAHALITRTPKDFDHNTVEKVKIITPSEMRYPPTAAHHKE